MASYVNWNENFQCRASFNIISIYHFCAPATFLDNEIRTCFFFEFCYDDVSESKLSNFFSTALASGLKSLEKHSHFHWKIYRVHGNPRKTASAWDSMLDWRNLCWFLQVSVVWFFVIISWMLLFLIDDLLLARLAKEHLNILLLFNFRKRKI